MNRVERLEFAQPSVDGTYLAHLDSGYTAVAVRQTKNTLIVIRHPTLGAEARRCTLARHIDPVPLLEWLVNNEGF